MQSEKESQEKLFSLYNVYNVLVLHDFTMFTVWYQMDWLIYITQSNI